jgi:hypothetical protein
MKISKLLPAVGVFAVCMSFCMSFTSVRAQDNPAQAAAREALMKQMDQVQAPELQTPPAAPATPATPPVVAEPPAVPAVVVVQTPADAAQPASTNSTDADAEEKARLALLAKMAVASPQPVMTRTVAGPVPIVAPAIPVSMTKEMRLQALLARYKADQITPEQYHTQRAAILAEP